MSEKLKPCPFCGNDFLGVYTVHGSAEDLFTWEGYVTCHNCNAKGKHFYTLGDMTVEEVKLKAIAGWNERVEG